jgi:hypothetical protein
LRIALDKKSALLPFFNPRIMSIAYMVMQGEYYPQAILFSVIFELLGVKANAFVTFPIIPEYMFCLQAGAFTAFRIQPPWKCNMAAVKPEITPPQAYLRFYGT